MNYRVFLNMDDGEEIPVGTISTTTPKKKGGGFGKAVTRLMALYPNGKTKELPGEMGKEFTAFIIETWSKHLDCEITIAGK